MRVLGDVEAVNLQTGARYRRLTGDGESRLIPCNDVSHIKLGPRPETDEEFNHRFDYAVSQILKGIQKQEINSMAALRLKMTVNSVKKVADGQGNIVSEELSFNAVYGPEGTPNSQWSKWTPSASLSMTINNPDAFGKLLPGQFVFADLTVCEKDSI